MVAIAPSRVLPMRRDGASNSRALPEEMAIAISYNGSTHAVMMATPADLEDFAKGFTLTEGVARLDEIRTIEPVVTALGIDLQIWLTEEAAARQSDRRRTMAGPVGCGLCGIESLEAAMRCPPKLATGFTLHAGDITRAVTAMEAAQPLHDETRAVHAAAFWDGRLRACREDVGRHNALDKLVGALGGQGQDGALVLTCRVSVDMVQKAAVLGASVVIAVSAPTAAAVDLADRVGLTLIGLARRGSYEVFTHPQRIKA